MGAAERIYPVKLGKHQRRKIYIALEDTDMIWDEKDALEFDHMWREGLSGEDIARAFGRDPDEIGLLVIDRKRKGFIEDRPGGWFGRRRRA